MPEYKQYEGNQPSLTILLQELNPYSLGMLIAMYEHKVFVQSVLWNINPFDQWGVEKGKEIANQLLPILNGDRKGYFGFRWLNARLTTNIIRKNQWLKF